MFGLMLELLSGRYAATAYNDRFRAEWPPHPARLFSALVATWADGEPDGAQSEQELESLLWLEQQAPPDILASPKAQAGLRDVVPVFVPVNDVGVVLCPDRSGIDAAEAALAACADPQAALKAHKQAQKLRQKLLEETAKAVAPPKTNKGGAAAEALLPDRRLRQPRTFPSATPACASVAFVWGSELPPRLQPAMSRLMSRLVRVGHSSTLVRGAVGDAVALDGLLRLTTRYCPDDSYGNIVIRWVAPGQVAQLGRAFEQHQETEPRVLPARFVRYREGERAPSSTLAHSLFEDDFIVLARVGGPQLPITSTVGVARQLRRALMSTAGQPVPEIISGHRPDGAASGTAHLAVVPLPMLSGPRPDGLLAGVALILPREVSAEVRLTLLRALGGLEKAATLSLTLGDAGVLRLERDVWGDDLRSTLRPLTWSRPSRLWASATPVALDRNPGDLQHSDPLRRQAAFADATACIVEAVRRIGLPGPVEVDVVRSCVLAGTAKPSSHPRYPIDPKRPQRVLVHVSLAFGEAVHGPLLLGAGRYLGLGLFLPLDPCGAQNDVP